MIETIKLRSIALALGASIIGTAVAPTVSAQNITFDQILASPDDLELNLSYARQEVASGRLQQAAAALERLLLLRPNWDSARLFYGVVLYRLGDLKGAARELALLEGRQLSATQERDRVRYLGLANKQTKTLRFSSQFTLGARLDSNPGFVSDDVVEADDETDLAFTASSRFRVEADVGAGRGNYVYFQSNTHLNEFFDVDQADLISSRVQAGAVLHGSNSRFTPYALYGVAYVQDERFRQQYGGGLRTNWTLSSQVDLHVNGEAVYEEFDTTDFSTVGGDRDGWRSTGKAGLSWRPSDAQSFRLTGLYTRKDAELDGFSYDRQGVQFNSLTLLGSGRYLAVTASYTHTEYDAPDDFHSATVARDDDRYFVRAALGAPLETLFARTNIELPEFLSDIVAQIGVSYTNQDSNIDVLNYDNVSGDILFTKRIQF